MTFLEPVQLRVFGPLFVSLLWSPKHSKHKKVTLKFLQQPDTMKESSSSIWKHDNLTSLQPRNIWQKNYFVAVQKLGY